MLLHISDEQLERFGKFYCSEFVAKQMPWLKEVPFHVWLERQTETCRNVSNQPEMCS